VKSVQVIKSSGDEVFDRSAVTAVYKAAPLPLPKDPKDAAEFRSFNFDFKP
jgi:colicin import membrane protein